MPPSMNYGKKQRKTKATVISSSKLEKIKGIFHAKMGTIKERNSKDLIEAEEIKKGWKGYTGELYKKDLNDPDNHNGALSLRARHSGV